MNAGSARGISLFELAIVLCIASLVLVALSRRITRLQAEAEIVQMEYVVRALQGALLMDVATAIAGNRRHELRELIGTNPVARLPRPPANYIGELVDPEPDAIDGGSWYFDRGRRLLIYRVRNAAYFSTDLAGPARARFKFTAVHSDPSESAEGLKLAPVEPYRWARAPATEE